MWNCKRHCDRVFTNVNTSEAISRNTVICSMQRNMVKEIVEILTPFYMFCIIACLAINNYKYKVFLKLIKEEDSRNGVEFDYDRAAYYIGSGIFHVKPPVPIIRQSKHDHTNKIIRQHNFFAKLFWGLIIMIIPIALVLGITNR